MDGILTQIIKNLTLLDRNLQKKSEDLDKGNKQKSLECFDKKSSEHENALDKKVPDSQKNSEDTKEKRNRRFD